MVLMIVLNMISMDYIKKKKIIVDENHLLLIFYV